MTTLREALEGAGLAEAPAQPEKPLIHCPGCDREIHEPQWHSMRRLAFSGVLPGDGVSRPSYTIEIRECVCLVPIGRRTSIPMIWKPSP